MSGIIFLRLFMFVVIGFIFLCQAAWAANAEMKYTWVLTQRHEESGEFIIYVAPDAVKIVSLTNGGNLLAKGPDWKVVCFRPDDKIQWATSLATFRGLYSVASGISNGEKNFTLAPKLIRVAKGVDHGVAYSSYIDKEDHVFWLADDFKTSPQIVEVVCRCFSLPGTRQFVLRLSRTGAQPDAKDSPHIVNAHKNTAWAMSNLISYRVEHEGDVKLETKSVKKIVYNAADFDYPKNFKQVHTLAEVLFSKSQQGDLVDFINDLGFTSQPKSKTGSEK